MENIKNEKAEILKDFANTPCLVIQKAGNEFLETFSTTDLTVFVVDYGPKILDRLKERKVQLVESLANVRGERYSASDTTQEQHLLLRRILYFIGSTKGAYSQVFDTPAASQENVQSCEFSNKERAESALEALSSSKYRASVNDGDYHSAVTDLLVDLMHLCDREKLDFFDVLRFADCHHDAEVEEEKKMKRRGKRTGKQAEKKPRKK
jgi:hypothetical protein